MTLIEYIQKKRKSWQEPQSLEFYQNELENISNLYHKYYYMDYDRLIRELIEDLAYHKGNNHVVELLAELEYTQEEIENFGFTEEEVRKVLDYDYLD